MIRDVFGSSLEAVDAGVGRLLDDRRLLGDRRLSSTTGVLFDHRGLFDDGRLLDGALVTGAARALLVRDLAGAGRGIACRERALGRGG